MRGAYGARMAYPLGGRLSLVSAGVWACLSLACLCLALPVAGRAGAGGRVLSVIPGRVSPWFNYPRGLLFFFSLLLFWLGVGRGRARGRGLP
jgi:hypothetical protein